MQNWKSNMPILATLPSLASMITLMFYPGLVSNLIFSPALTVFLMMVFPIASAVYKDERNRNLVWLVCAIGVFITFFGGVLLPENAVVFSRNYFEFQNIVALSLMVSIPAFTGMSLYKRRLTERGQTNCCMASCRLK